MPWASRHWDVVRIDFPYADSVAAGRRPALVVATPAATGAFGIVWVLMITSARHAPWPDDILVSDLAAAGLGQPSVVRSAKIAAIDSRLVTTIGRLAKPDRIVVRDRLRQHLGLVLAA